MLNQIALLILGMHRSGTSAWAGLLSALEFQLPKRLLPANEFNRKGYFEPEAIVRVHDRYLAEIGRTWSSVHPLKEDELQNHRSDALVQELCDVVAEEFEPGEPWIIKDPRICILMPVWRRVLRELEAEPRVLVPLRQPYEVARSLASRDGMSLDHGYFLWLRHVLDAERHTRELRRAFIASDTLTEDWRRSLCGVDEAIQLGLKTRIDRAGGKTDGFIEPGMMHREAPPADETEGEAPQARQWAKDVHDIVGVMGAKPSAAQLQRLDAIRGEFDGYARAVGAVAVDLERALRARIRQYFDERAKRLRAERELAQAQLSIEKLRGEELSAQEAANRRIAQLQQSIEENRDAERRAEERTNERIAQLQERHKEAFKKIDRELTIERRAAICLAEQLIEVTDAIERVMADHHRAAEEHARLRALYTSEALVRERLQNDHAALLEEHETLRIKAERLTAEREKLAFEQARLSGQIAALTGFRDRAEAVAKSLQLRLEEQGLESQGLRATMQAEIEELRATTAAQAEALARSRADTERLRESALRALKQAEDLALSARALAQHPMRTASVYLSWAGTKAVLSAGLAGPVRKERIRKSLEKLDPERFVRSVSAQREKLEQEEQRARQRPAVVARAQERARPNPSRAASAEPDIVASVRLTRMLYVSHDAHPHGAQMLSLSILQSLKEDLGLEVEAVLLDDGPLLPRFEALAPVHRLRGRDAQGEEATALAQSLYARGFRSAIANTVVSGLFAETLKRAGLRVVSLVHEMAGVIRSGGFERHARAIADHADRVIFAAPMVRSAFEQFALLDDAMVVIRPQGLYKERATSDPAEIRGLRAQLRQQLGLSPQTGIVINVGFGDARKGVDLFCEVAKDVIQRRDDIAFVWVGGLHLELEDSLRRRAGEAPFDGRLKFMGLIDPSLIGSIYSGADLLALTSREDPFPSVVMEAFDAGLPVVAFEGATGTNDLIRTGPGELVAAFDISAMAEAVIRRIDREETRASVKAQVNAVLADEFDFRRYVLDVAALADPAYRRVSVILPKAGGTRVEERLRNICAQAYPIYEIIVVDDAELGASRTWLDLDLTSLRPRAKLIRAKSRAHSPLDLWREGVAQARGDYIWIASPDDMAAPNFLDTVLKGFTQRGVVLSHCQSRLVDEGGTVRAESWLGEVEDLSPGRWAAAYVDEGSTEIAKALAIKNSIPCAGAVVVARAPLQAAFDAVVSPHKPRETFDWLLWTELLRQGRIAYAPQALNDRRIKSSGQTDEGRWPKPPLQEVLRAQAYAQAAASVDDNARRLASGYAWETYQTQRAPVPPPQPRAEVKIPPPLAIPDLKPPPPPPIEASVHNALEAFARVRANYYRVSPVVHEHDFIYRFIHSPEHFASEGAAFAGKRDAVHYYFDDGRQSADQLRDILAGQATRHLLEKDRISLLEFASGYGCVTRHLPSVFPNADIVSVDIHPEAVEFIAKELGQAAALSTRDPQAFRLERSFDVVFALSFFSHMPDRTWGKWLGALFRHVAPGGALVFTTHGMSSRDHFGNPALDERGYWFSPQSEQKDLPVEDYGQTIVTPGYVLRQMYEHAPAPLVHFQDGFWWGHQDVYVLVKPLVPS